MAKKMKFVSKKTQTILEDSVNLINKDDSELTPFERDVKLSTTIITYAFVTEPGMDVLVHKMVENVLKFDEDFNKRLTDKIGKHIDTNLMNLQEACKNFISAVVMQFEINHSMRDLKDKMLKDASDLEAIVGEWSKKIHLLDYNLNIDPKFIFMMMRFMQSIGADPLAVFNVIEYLDTYRIFVDGYKEIKRYFEASELPFEELDTMLKECKTTAKEQKPMVEMLVAALTNNTELEKELLDRLVEE